MNDLSVLNQHKKVLALAKKLKYHVEEYQGIDDPGSNCPDYQWLVCKLKHKKSAYKNLQKTYDDNTQDTKCYVNLLCDLDDVEQFLEGVAHDRKW